MQTVDHQGRTTAYRRHERGGTGPTTLFVHGSGGDRRVWKAQARLAEDVEVVTIDLSGHGASSDVDANPGYEALDAYAADVLAVADRVEADAFVGSSLGAAVCLHAALERDVDPKALVLAGVGARMPVLGDLLAWLSPNGDFERAIGFLTDPGRLFETPDEELREVTATAMRDCGRAVVERDFRTCHAFDVEEDLPDLAVPTLAVVGEHDRLTPRWYHEELVEAVPRAELTVVEDAAHLAMLERPTGFNAALRRFLVDAGR
jgi:pimeloyl-ACP methyl ester carboxylesterase